MYDNKNTVVVYVHKDLTKIHNARAALVFCNENVEHVVVALGSSSQDMYLILGRLTLAS